MGQRPGLGRPSPEPVGIYTTPEGREAAKALYAALISHQWPFASGGEWVEWTVEADPNLISPEPETPTA